MWKVMLLELNYIHTASGPGAYIASGSHPDDQLIYGTIDETSLPSSETPGRNLEYYKRQIGDDYHIIQQGLDVA